MNKIKSLDEFGRSKAMERYEQPAPKTEHGHMHIGADKAHKFETELPKLGIGSLDDAE